MSLHDSERADDGSHLDGPGPAGRRIRVAAVGDLHLTVRRVDRFRPALRRVRDHADVLLLAGDLTERGTVEEAHCLAAEVADLGIAVIAVLGNHDHLSGHGATVTAALTECGVQVLEESATVVTVAGVRLGVAGMMGFSGGFEPDPEDGRADRFGRVLRELDCGVRVALTHYAPAAATLRGEPDRLYPVLGSRTIGAAIEGAGTHLAVHGHAHRGREAGATPGGVAVRNVAYPVIRQEFRLYDIEVSADGTARVTTMTQGRFGGWVRWVSATMGGPDHEH